MVEDFESGAHLESEIDRSGSLREEWHRILGAGHEVSHLVFRIEEDGEVWSELDVPSHFIDDVEVHHSHDGDGEVIAIALAELSIFIGSADAFEAGADGSSCQSVTTATGIKEDTGLDREIITDIKVSHYTDAEAGAPRFVMESGGEGRAGDGAIGGIDTNSRSESDEIVTLLGGEEIGSIQACHAESAQGAEQDFFHTIN